MSHTIRHSPQARSVEPDKATISRVASRWLLATKSQGEKEDAEVERLVRPSPKLKPPRDDSKRNRIQTEGDADLSKDDGDLSMNYKDV